MTSSAAPTSSRSSTVACRSRKPGREYRACCPFHDEKTPSFWVSPVKQFYHCFGCGAHGTVLGFLMNYDRLPFVEAVEELASRLGVDVPREETPGAAPLRTIDEDLYALMSRVATFYREQLKADARATAYAARRGLDADVLDRFSIGYAPDAWSEVLKRFGASDVDAAEAAGDRSHHRARERRRSLRPLPRPADVSDPRCARTRDRLRRSRARPGRTEST